MNGQQSFESWWEESKDEISQIQAFAVADIPDDAMALARDLSRSVRDEARARFLLSDAESFLAKAAAAAVLSVRNQYPELGADERKAMVKDSVRDFVRLRDNLSAICGALKSKAFAAMSLNRTMLQAGND